MKILMGILSFCAFSFVVEAQNWSEKSVGTFSIITNTKGPALGYSPTSGINILTIDGLAFKDLNRNGRLDVYEDWRVDFADRAKDLASKLSIEQIAGLMLFGMHQSIPSPAYGFGAGTYQGKPLSVSGLPSSAVSDQQRKFLIEGNLRHVLITTVESPEVAAQWNNNVQALVEGSGFGIPANNGSDPRHQAVASTEYHLGSGGKSSMWPKALGLAATFDAELIKMFGKIAAEEYRALGITTALSPQIDLGTEPRWNRIDGTFGEDPMLAANMAKSYVDGFQTSEGNHEIKEGWGFRSVNAMVKHWPGGGAGESGRDGHFAYGKFAVYPGNHFQTHLIPFIEGAFKLDGKTNMASAVMPYYTISYDQDKKYYENVANGYSKYIITDLLREKYKYDGVVCTDWGITWDEANTVDVFAGKPWGTETLSVAERHYKVIMAGVDQFGGNNDPNPILAAYELGVKENGKEIMRKRFERSAVRLLLNIFRTGLFENPYVDPLVSKTTVGNADFMKSGFDAQLKSIVMLKNKSSVLPLKKNSTVFVPKRTIPEGRDWFGNIIPARVVDAANLEVVRRYFQVTDDPAAADAALVFVESPVAGSGYSRGDRVAGGNGYVPISLQYGTYTASTAREESMAAGDPVLDPLITNRSYKGKTLAAANVADLQLILDTKNAMKSKPVILIANVSNPLVFAEFETKVDGILISFGVQDQAILEILVGAEPSGLLPVQMPADMLTVERQMEDVPHDMNVHVDTEGNAYDFGYGLNYKGLIRDERVARYKSNNTFKKR
jgi:beta-glucosidase